MPYIPVYAPAKNPVPYDDFLAVSVDFLQPYTVYELDAFIVNGVQIGVSSDSIWPVRMLWDARLSCLYGYTHLYNKLYNTTNSIPYTTTTARIVCLKSTVFILVDTGIPRSTQLHDPVANETVTVSGQLVGHLPFTKDDLRLVTALASASDMVSETRVLPVPITRVDLYVALPMLTVGFDVDSAFYNGDLPFTSVGLTGDSVDIAQDLRFDTAGRSISGDAEGALTYPLTTFGTTIVGYGQADLSLPFSTSITGVSQENPTSLSADLAFSTTGHQYGADSAVLAYPLQTTNTVVEGLTYGQTEMPLQTVASEFSGYGSISLPYQTFVVAPVAGGEISFGTLNSYYVLQAFAESKQTLVDGGIFDAPFLTAGAETQYDGGNTFLPMVTTISATQDGVALRGTIGAVSTIPADDCRFRIVSEPLTFGGGVYTDTSTVTSELAAISVSAVLEEQTHLLDSLGQFGLQLDETCSITFADSGTVEGGPVGESLDQVVEEEVLAAAFIEQCLATVVDEAAAQDGAAIAGCDFSVVGEEVEASSAVQAGTDFTAEIDYEMHVEAVV